MVNVAILGYGTIGSGVANVLWTNKEVIDKKTGEDVRLKYVLDLRDFPGDKVESILTHDFNTILEDDSVQVVVETMGGLKPAYDFVKKCLLAGKSVCTSNKALVENSGAELNAIAAEKNANFLFEASVGGGIPIIRPINECITADVILEISGILNGTTNFILTKMGCEGLDFDTVLKEAQDLGYAEKDPTADVEGHDAGRKIAILSSLAAGSQVNFEDVYTEGITKITDKDFEYAKALNATIKLVATSKLADNGGRCVMVTPRMLPLTHPLAGVNGVMNAIFVKGNMLGDAMFYGAGAGSLPTASAVAGDIVDAIRNLGRNKKVEWKSEPLKLLSVDDVKNRFFVRISGDDEAAARKAFGAGQVLRVTDGEYGYVTGEMTEKAFADAKGGLNGVIGYIRFS